MFRNAPLKDCTLYVPKGTGIMYMSAPVWINFGNIIEVDEPEEACYVTIRQGEGGAVKQSVKLGESYSYVFTPDAGWKIHTVTFNGEDVTSLLYNGQYSTPVITGDSELSVVYVEDTQGISQAVGESPVRVIAHGQSLSVSGVKDGSTVYVYDTQGKLLETTTGTPVPAAPDYRMASLPFALHQEAAVLRPAVLNVGTGTVTIDNIVIRRADKAEEQVALMLK
jgi:hypothetical protein